MSQLGFNRPSVDISNRPPAKEIRTFEYDMINNNMTNLEKKGLTDVKKQMTKEPSTDLINTIVNKCIKHSHNTKESYMYQGLKYENTVDYMKSFVCGSKYGENQWIKIYKTENASNYKPIIESEFIFEVYYQKKAHELNESCAFISPAVIDYGAFVNEGSVYHYIIMDYIPETKLKKDECDAIKQNVEAVDTCLRKNGIYHNDLAARNVFNRNGNPIIIDFGLALNKERDKFFSLNCIDDVPPLPKQTRSRAVTPSPKHSVTPSPPPSPIGGKRKKPHYSKKKKRISKKKRMSKKKKRVS
jgi:serine/threonine protein kinase